MIKLVPMTDELYINFLAVAIKDYAEDHVRDGKWTADQSIERSTEEFNKLLPDGIHTEGHNLYSIHHEVLGIVGVLWYAISIKGNEKAAFIYDIRVYDEFQGKGFGKQALTALESALVPIGVDSIGLHVFGHNQRAYNLYLKTGYTPINIRMSKKLGGIK